MENMLLFKAYKTIQKRLSEMRVFSHLKMNLFKIKLKIIQININLKK